MSKYQLYVDGDLKLESASLHNVVQQLYSIINRDEYTCIKNVTPLFPWERKEFIVKRVYVNNDYTSARPVIIKKVIGKPKEELL